MGATSSGAKEEPGSGWGWNPLTDFQKATSSVGGWINKNVPGGNWGLGSVLTFAPAGVAGIAGQLVDLGENLSKGVVRHDWTPLREQGQQVSGGLLHGLADTSTDITTLGGLAPWKDAQENAWEKVTGYRTQSMRDYFNKKGEGPGLGGALMNDALNVAIGAGTATKLAKLGDVGKAAQAARLAEEGAKAAETANAASDLGKISEAGNAARAGHIADAAGHIAAETGEDAATIAEKIASRAKILDRLETVHNAADTAMNPWRLFRGPVGDLTRAASKRLTPDLERDAGAPGATEGVSGASESTNAFARKNQVPTQEEFDKMDPGHQAYLRSVGLTPGADPNAVIVPEMEPVAAGADSTVGKPQFEPGHRGLLHPEPANPAQAHGADWVPGGAPAPDVDVTRMSVEDKAIYDKHIAKMGIDPNTPEGEAMRRSLHERVRGLAQPIKGGAKQVAQAGKELAKDERVKDVRHHTEAATHNAHLSKKKLEEEKEKAKAATAILNEMRRQVNETGARSSGDLSAEGADHHEVEKALAEGGEKAGESVALESVRGELRKVQEEKATEAVPGAPGAEASRKLTPVTPAEQFAYNYYSKDIPPWAKTVVEHAPEAIVRGLQYVDQRTLSKDFGRVLRQNERAVAVKIAETSKDPAISQAVGLAEDLLKRKALENNTPIDASRAVGERIFAAATQRPLWERLERQRPQLEATAPGVIERTLDFRVKLPPEVDTPEFRENITNIADQIGRLTKGASELMLQSRAGEKGLTALGSIEPKLSAKGKGYLRAATSQEKAVVARRIKMEAEAEKIRQQTYGTRDAEFEYAKRQRDAAMQARIGARAGEKGPFESVQARLDWANKLNEMADQRVIRAKALVAELDENLAKLAAPHKAAMAALRNEAGKNLDKVAAELENPKLKNTPTAYQPMVHAMNQLAQEVRDFPELEPLLKDVPKNFSQAVSYFVEQGYDPAFLSEMTPSQTRSMLMGVSRLGGSGQMARGGEFLSASRSERAGILRTTGAMDKRVEAIVAGIVRATHEDRTNHVIDFMERVVARRMPRNEFGQPVRVPGWKEWDPMKRSLLGIEDVQTGQTRVLSAKGKAPLMIPTSVYNQLHRYTQSFDNPFYRAISKMTNPWRALVLTMSPKFYVAHIMGHMTLAMLSGGNRLSDWVKAWEVAKKDEFGNRFSALPQVDQQSIMRSLGGEPSLIDPSFMDAVRSGSPLAVTHDIAGKMHNVVATTDAFARAVTYFSQMRKMAKQGGMTWDAMNMRAMNYAQDALVDYQDLTNFEQHVVKAAMPFYGFQKGILKIAMRMPLDHPLTASILLTLGRINEENSVDKDGNPLPEAYLNTVDAFGTHIDLHSLNPFKDVVNLTTPEGIVSSLQYALQAVVRSGLHDPAPGTKAQGVTVDAYGRTVPNVPIGTQVAAAFTNSPQGKLLDTNVAKGPGEALKNFFGVKTFSDEQLAQAGQQNVLSKAQAALSPEAQQKAAAAGAAVSKATALKALGGQATGKPLVTGPGIDPAKLNAALAAYTTQQTEKKAANIQAGKTSPSRTSRVRKLTVRRGGHRGGSGVHFKRTHARRISRKHFSSHVHIRRTA